MSDTCRDEILEAAHALLRRTGEYDFAVGDVVREMRERGSRYRDSSISTHVKSLMCRNAPSHHATRYPDFERVARGRYRFVDTTAEWRGPPVRPGSRLSASHTRPEPHGRRVKDLGPAFHFLQIIEVKRDQDGQPITYDPGNRYINTAGLRRHQYGNGPFCRFSIDQPPGLRGVYALCQSEDVMYVGIADDLAQRYNQGYGTIQPRNCFERGQSTNCRVNRLILQEAEAGRSLVLWFEGASQPRPLEAELIRRLQPPWNLQS